MIKTLKNAQDSKRGDNLYIRNRYNKNGEIFTEPPEHIPELEKFLSAILNERKNISTPEENK